MAEAVAVVAIVSSIVQLVDFSSRVLHQLDGFESNLGRIPKTFQHIKSELPVLQHALQQTKEAIDDGSIGDATRRAVFPVIEGCREQIQSLDAILAKTLPSPDDSRGTRVKLAISSVYQEAKVEDILKTLGRYIRTLTFYHVAASSTFRTLSDEKLSKYRRWLSTPDPSFNYKKALKQRQADTGLWFLESEQYAKWKTAPASFLWLYGIPGCGKTILSSTIIENVFQYRGDDPGKMVIYFYFDFNDMKKQIPEVMVQSLVCQISQHYVNVPAALGALFSSCANGEQRPSLDACLQALRQMIEEFPQTFIILDALDECGTRAELMDILGSMMGWGLETLHILVTSRRERDIESSLECFVDKKNMVCLENALVDEDICTYVHQRLTNDKSLRKWQKDHKVWQNIEDALKIGARGMFRWAVCQLDTLGKCRNRSMLRKALATLPSTLDETYDRILCSIDEDDSEYAVRILQWLSFSERPLLVEEVAEVVAINPERDPAFDREEVLEDPLDVLNICSSLVVISTTDEQSAGERHDSSKPTERVVRLAHYSVKEYLTSERCGWGRSARYRMHDTSCNEFIAKSCLGYLYQFQKSDSLTIEAIKQSKLAEYAARSWIVHAKAVLEKGDSLNRLIMDFFSTGNGAYLSWLRIHEPGVYGRPPDATRKLETVPTALYYASLFGLTEIARLLIVETKANVNAQSGPFGTPLMAAVTQGRKETVELLLNQGAEVNAQDESNGNALHQAATSGRKEIVELLLSQGAKVNAEGGFHGSALQAAACSGYDEMVGLLLSQGAEVNKQGGHFGSALQAAAAKGHKEIVMLLLNKGAEINAQCGFYGNALQGAATEGRKEIVVLLLNKGADVDAQGGILGSAINAAAYMKHRDILELLVFFKLLKAEWPDN